MQNETSDPAKKQQVKDSLRELLQVQGESDETLLEYLVGGSVPGEEWKSFSESGRQLAESGAHEKALAAYDKAIELKSDDGVTWANRGRSLEALGNIEMALASYAKAAELEPELIIEAEQARAYMRLGQLAKALTFYDAAILKEPDNPPAVHNRSICLLQMDRPEEALAGFNRVLSLNPAHVPAAKMKVDALHALRRESEAREATGVFLSIYQPEDLSGRLRKATMALQAGFAGVAETSFRAVTELYPEKIEAWHGLGASLSTLERHEESAKAFGRGLEIDPNNSELHAARATVLLRSWRSALELGRKELLTEARRTAILEACRSWKKREPNSGQAFLSEGSFHLVNHDFERALSCFREAEKLGEPKAGMAIAAAQKMRQTTDLQSPQTNFGAEKNRNRPSWLRRLFGA